MASHPSNNKSAKDRRNARLPLVSHLRLERRMPFRQIAAEVERQLGYSVTPKTIKTDWDLLVSEWRAEAASNTQQACDEAREALQSRLDEREALTVGEIGDDLEEP